MVAPIQTQPSPLVARALAADASAFKPGQVLDALVLGKAPDGTVSLKIGELVVAARLPVTLPPGTTLQLQVKTGGPAPQLAIIGAPQVPEGQVVQVPPLPLAVPQATVLPQTPAQLATLPPAPALPLTAGAPAVTVSPTMLTSPSRPPDVVLPEPPQPTKSVPRVPLQPATSTGAASANVDGLAFGTPTTSAATSFALSASLTTSPGPAAAPVSAATSQLSRSAPISESPSQASLAPAPPAAPASLEEPAATRVPVPSSGPSVVPDSDGEMSPIASTPAIKFEPSPTSPRLYVAAGPVRETLAPAPPPVSSAVGMSSTTVPSSASQPTPSLLAVASGPIVESAQELAPPSSARESTMAPPALQGAPADVGTDGLPHASMALRPALTAGASASGAVVDDGQGAVPKQIAQPGSAPSPAAVQSSPALHASWSEAPAPAEHSAVVPPGLPAGEGVVKAVSPDQAVTKPGSPGVVPRAPVVASTQAAPAVAASPIQNAAPLTPPGAVLPKAAKASAAVSMTIGPSVAAPQAVAEVASNVPSAATILQSRAPVARPTAEADAPNPLLLAQGAARPQPTASDFPRPLMVTPQTQPSPSTPAAALAQMVPEAMARQNSVAPLLASLAALVARPGVPEPVLRAALQVLGQKVAIPASGPTATAIEAALAKSGVYLEAALAKGAPAADLKSALVALKGAAANWLGGNPAPVTPAQQVAPPLRGLPPRVEWIESPPLPEAPRDAARLLHSQADAALSRVKLTQLASLPDADPTRAAAPPELRMDVPFVIGQQLVMAQFQVFRDREQRRSEGKRGWTMRFAINFAEAGEVGAEIGLFGRTVNVALWAADPATAADLEAALPELAPALAAIGLEPGGVRVRTLPPDPAKPASGHFVDSRR